MDDNTYQFDDVETESAASPASNAGSANQGDGHSGGHRSSGRGGFAEEIHSITHHARQRTFYFDLKQSGNGKFLKISEKSRGGRKTTIMMDEEDVQPFIDALQEMKGKIA